MLPGRGCSVKMCRLLPFVPFLQLCLGVVLGLNVSFQPSNVEVFVDRRVDVAVTFEGTVDELQGVRDSNWTASYEPTNVLGAEFSVSCNRSAADCSGTLDIEGRFLGFGTVTLSRWDAESRTWIRSGPALAVTVQRLDKTINRVFVAFVAIVVSLNYVNMGCALDLAAVKHVIRKPIGPIVGFVCQFVVMPLVSYGVGQLIFDDPVLRFGLFTFASSPGGGASNMWTVLLGGNLNLSIAMTFISTLAALGTIPLWLFTLGKTILQGTKVVIPYENILASLASLTIPIGLGVLIQKRYPNLAARSKRTLAPVCIILIVCIVVLASVANTYMFFMLTWRMVIAASLSVWTGFLSGALVSMLFRFQRSDVIAVAVETGIQNSGIAFLLLTYSLKPPVSDMAAVVPVAGSIITPVPLFVIYCCQWFRNYCFRSDIFELDGVSSTTALDEKCVCQDNEVDNEFYLYQRSKESVALRK